MSTPLPLETTGLAKRFTERRWNGGRREVLALEELTLALSPGEAFGLVGPNGAGKSTAIKILLGLIRADAGEAHLHGVPVSDPASRRGLGYLPEQANLYGHLSAREMVASSGRMHGLPAREAAAEAHRWLQRLGLAQQADLPLRGLSKGMTQRAALAHALAGRPRLLILDEPLSGLDPVWRKAVVDTLAEFRDGGGTLLFSSHILGDVERLADRIGVLDRGRLRETTTPGDLMAAYVTRYTVRSQGPSAPAGLDARPEGGGQWALEAEAEGLWPAMETLRAADHRLLEVRPAGAGLEEAFLGLLREHEPPAH